MAFDVKHFGAVGDGVTDDTNAIQAAIDAAYAAGGGTVFVPKGAYAVTGLSRSFAGLVPIMFKGEGKFASTFLKIAGADAAILTLSAEGVLDVYGGFEDIGFRGVSFAGTGLRLNQVARIRMDRVLFTHCEVGLDIVGSLIFQLRDCSVNSNKTGVKVRRARDLSNNITGPGANLLVFDGCEVRGNSAWGVDLDEGTGHAFRSVNFEMNGTRAVGKGTISHKTLVLTDVVGTIGIGDVVSGAGVEDCTVITSFGTGAGGNGTYIVDKEQEIPAGTDMSVSILDSGAVIIRAGVVGESGYANFVFDGCWIEGNNGRPFVCEDGLINLMLTNCFWISNDGGRDVEIGNIRNANIVNVIAPSSNATFRIAAAQSQVIGSHINALKDQSSRKFHLNVVTGGATLNSGIGTGPVQWQPTALGFYGASPTTKPTSVPANDLAALHAALVSLGLISA